MRASGGLARDQDAKVGRDFTVMLRHFYFIPKVMCGSDLPVQD